LPVGTTDLRVAPLRVATGQIARKASPSLKRAMLCERPLSRRDSDQISLAIFPSALGVDLTRRVVDDLVDLLRDELHGDGTGRSASNYEPAGCRRRPA
jgi:hypothetical protein